MRVRKVILAAVLSAILGSVGWVGYRVYHCLSVTVPNAYAVWWVADMVTRYMEAHDGAWPRGWEDLRGPYEEMTEQSGRPWTFESLRDRVEVDWQADPTALRETKPVGDSPPFRVIWLRNGGHEHWSSREPNRMIWDYLQEKRGKGEEEGPGR